MISEGARAPILQRVSFHRVTAPLRLEGGAP
jgi:hypothetical protein